MLPVALDTQTATISEDSLLTVSPNASDVDLDILTLTVDNVSNGTATVDVNGDIVFTPTADFNGEAIISYTASDDSVSDTGIITVTVTAENDAGVLEITGGSGAPDTELSFILTDVDGIEGQEITVSLLDNNGEVIGTPVMVLGVEDIATGTILVPTDVVEGEPISLRAGYEDDGATVYNGGVDGGNPFISSEAITVSANEAPTAVNDIGSIDEDAVTPVLIDVLSNDSDQEGQTLTVTQVTGDDNGTAMIVGNQISYIANADFSGIETLTYTLSDSVGATNIAEVSITVNAINDAPVALDTQTATISEDSLLTVSPNASDVDLDILSITVDNVSNGTATVDVNGDIVFTPTADFNGEAIISYTASDDSVSDTGIITVTVTAENDAPVALDTQTATISEDSLLTVSPNASDVDLDILTLTVDNVSNGTATVDVNGDIVFTPTADFNGEAIISYTASDDSVSDTGIITVTVTAENDAGVLEITGGSGAPDTELSFSLTDLDGIEGQEITVSLLDNNGEVIGTPVMVLGVEDIATGTILVPTDVVEGEPISLRAGYEDDGATVYNGGVDGGNPFISSEAITVSANEAPTAVNDIGSIDEDAVTPVLIDVLSNDSDQEGQTLTVTQVTGDDNGTAMIVGNQISYIANADFSGIETLTYTLSDSVGATNIAEVSITVNGINDAPVALDTQTATISEDSLLTVSPNASDVDLDILTLTVDNVSNGTATVDVNGDIVFTPTVDFNGEAIISYTASDDSVSDTGIITVTVTAENDAPVALDTQTATISEDSLLTVSPNASDVDLDILTLTVDNVSNGTATVDVNGDIVFTPTADFNGEAIISYTASDDSVSDTGIITVTVTAENDAGVLEITGGSGAPDTELSFILTDVDGIEGQEITVSLLDNNGEVIGTPVMVLGVEDIATGTILVPTDVVEGEPISLRAGYEDDGATVYNGGVDGGNPFISSEAITVSANEAPTAVNDIGSIDEDAVTPVLIDVLSNDSDQEGQTLTVTQVTGDDNGTAMIVGNQISYIANADFSGIETLTYTLSDSVGATNIAEVSITVNGINDTPVALDTQTATISEDSLLTVSPNASDVDLDILSITVDNVSNGTATVDVNGDIVFTPTVDFNGEAIISYTASDDSVSDTGIITVTVTAENDAPVALDNQTATISEDSLLTVSPNASDVDLDILTLTVDNVSNGTATVDVNGDIVFTPTADFNGEAIISYTASDDSVSDTGIITVTVTAENDAGVLEITGGSGAPDTELSFSLTDLDGIEGQEITVSLLDNNGEVIGTPVMVLGVEDIATGTILVPTDVVEGEPISLRAGYEDDGATVYNGGVDGGNPFISSEAITVSANEAPTAVNDIGSIDEDAVTPVLIDVLSNDSDQEGQTLTVTQVTGDDNGTAMIVGNQISYIANADFSGIETLTYTLSDSVGATNIGEVSITVNGINDTPVALDTQTATISEDSLLTVSPNASDVDLDILSITVDNVSNGTATVDVNGDIVFTPTVDFNGEAIISYTASDDSVSDTGIITVTVTAENDAPVALDNQTATISEDSLLTVSPNASDVDLDILTLTVDNVSNGTATVDVNGDIVFTPTADFNGEAIISYTASDDSVSDTGIITVTVTAENDAGVLEITGGSGAPDTELSFILTDLDGIEGQEITVSLLDNNGEVIGTPVMVLGVEDIATGTILVPTDVVEGEPISLRAGYEDDGATVYNGGVDGGNPFISSEAITVSANEAPTAVNDIGSIDEDALSPVLIDVLANDSDQEGQTLTVTQVTGDDNGTAMIVGNQISYIANADFSGIETLTYTLSDSVGATNIAEVSITVNGINDAPVALDTQTATISEDSLLTVSPNASDVDGDILTITVDNVSNGTATVDVNGDIVFTPTADFNGEAIISYTASDDSVSDTGIITVTVTAENDAPAALDNQTATISEDSLLTVSPNASDVDLDILTITVDNVSNGTATVDVNGDIVFTPTANFNGEAIISYTASDDSVSDTGIITVTVTAENDAPIIGGTIPTNITISDDTASEIDLSLVEFSDVEDDNLTVNLTASTGTFSATLSEVISISGAGTGQVILIGSVIVINEYLDTSSNIEYTSDVSGGNVESFTITANDGMANSNISTVNLDILTVNDAPIIGGIIPTDITVTEDTASEVDLSLVDFSDIDSDNLTVSLTADSGTFVATSSAEVIVGGSGSVLTLTGNSSDLNSYLDMTSNIQYIGGSNVEGDNAASFTIVANDGLLNSVVNTVNVDIAGINDEAQITGASTGTAEITNVPEILPDGTITIMSPSGDFRAVSNLMDSNITIDNYSTTQNRGDIWTTNANGSSIDYFVAGENPVITVDFGSVQTLNTILVWAQGIGEIVPHTAREFDVEILNSEGVFVDGGTYNFDDFGAAEAFSAGTSLEIILSQTYATSQVRLTITDNYAGLGSLSYVESNVGNRVGLGELVFANFNDTSITGDLNHTDVDINNADDVWQVVDTATASIEGYGTYTIDVAGNWTYIVGNSNAVANAISTGQELTDSFTVYTEDGTSQLVTVTIARKNDTPIVDGIPTDITVTEDTASPVDLSGVNFGDIDGDDLIVSLTASAGIFTATSIGEVIVGGSGSELLTLSGGASAINDYLDILSNIQYTGASNVNGEDVAIFTIVVNDGFIDSVVNTVSLDISPVNDAPVALDTQTATISEDSLLTVSPNASDVDLDILTLTVDNVSNGTATVDVNGDIVFTPTADFNGEAIISYTASDDSVSDTGIITVTVTAENDAPVALDNQTATISEDSLLTVSPNASDVDLDILTLTVDNVSNGTATVDVNGDIVFTPTADFNGEAIISYTASDDSVSDTGIITVTVTAENDAPVALDDQTATISEDSLLTVSPNASDVDLDILTITVDNVSNGTATVDVNGDIVFTPTADFNGEAIISYTASDDSVSDTGIITVTVTAENDAPVALDNQTATISEDSLLTVSPNASDVDLDILTLTVDNVSNGTATVDVNGDIVFTPTVDFNGEAIISYTASDDSVSDTGIITVTVTAENDAPVALDNQTATISEDSLLTVSPNASDVDLDILTLRVDNVSNGTATVDVNGDIVFTPTADFNGEAIISYTASDDSVSDTGIITVTVTAENDAGVLEITGGSGAPDTELSFSLTDVDGIEGQEITVSLLDNNGEVIGTPVMVLGVEDIATGTILVPTDVVEGEPISLRAGYEDDGATVYNGGVDGGNPFISSEAITVSANEAPTAVNDIGSIDEDALSPVLIDVLANDSDQEGQTLTVTQVTGDDNGTAMIVGNQISYIANADFSGIEILTYTLSDSVGATNIAEVSITVNGINDTPVALDTQTATISEDSLLTVSPNASDVDLDILTLTVDNVSNGTATVDVNGDIVFTPTADFNGEAIISYTASDDSVSDTGIITVTVTAENDAPVALDNQTATISEDSLLTVSPNASDVDLDILTLTVDNVSNGTATVDVNGDIVFTPTVDFNGEAIISYTASDDSVSDTGIITVTVTAENDAPVALDTQTATISEDSLLTVSPNASDVDLDILTLRVDNVSNGTATVDVNGDIVFTPTADFNGEAIISYTASDDSVSDTGIITVTVTEENDAGVLEITGGSGAPDTELSFSLTDVDGIEGQEITVSLLDNNGEVIGTPVMVLGVEDIATGTILVPTDVVEGEPISLRAGYEDDGATVYNGGVDGGNPFISSEAITVSANEAPTAVNDIGSIDEDALSPVLIDVLANDSDQEGQTLTVTQVTGDDNGTAMIVGNQISYIANADFSGIEILTYTLSDSVGATNIAEVSITVNGINDTPVALDTQTATISEDSLLTVSPNASDVDLDILTLTVDNVSNGTATVDVNGDIVFTPTADFNGEAIISYTASDDSVSDTGIITVTVTAENDAPVALDNQTATISEDSLLTVSPNASDVDLDILTLRVDNVSNGTATVDVNGDIVFTPTADFNGEAIISYTASDDSVSDTGIITVTVTAENDAPTIGGTIPTNITISDDTASEIDLSLVEFSDVEDDNLTVNLTASTGTFSATLSEVISISGAGTGQVILTGSVIVINEYLDTSSNIEYTSDVSGGNVESFTITANDGMANSNISTVNLDILTVNDAPIIGGIIPTDITVTEDTASEVDLSLVDFSDIDSDNLTVSLTADTGTFVATSTGEVTVGGSGSEELTLTGNSSDLNSYLDMTSNIQYIGGSNVEGDNAASFTIVANDGLLNSVISTVNVDITGINDEAQITGDSIGRVEISNVAEILSDWTITSSTGNTDTRSADLLMEEENMITLDNYLTVQDGGDNWVTNISGSDYFVAGVNPVLTVNFGSIQRLSSILVWGHSFNMVSGTTFTHSVREFELEYLNSEGVFVDGGTYNFDNFSPSAAFSTGTSLEVILAESYMTSQVRLTITDNYFGEEDNFSYIRSNGGNRVGLNELAFANLNDTSITGDLNHTDVDVDNANDVWQVVDTATASIEGYGTYTIDVAGNWTYIVGNSNAVSDAISTGQELTDSFIVYTEDGTSQLVTVTIGRRNDAPTVGGIPTDITVTEDTANPVDLSGVNFGDIDGDDLIVSLTASAGIFTATSIGEVIVGGSGSELLTLSGGASAINDYLDILSNIQYTGASNVNGEDVASFTIVVNDGFIDSVVNTVSLDISPVNDAPVALDNQTATISEDSLLTVSPNASDVDLDILTITVDNVSNGTATVDVNGDIVFTPTANFNGEAIISYTASDDSVSDTGIITVTVTAENDAPIIGGTIPTNITISDDTASEIDLSLVEFSDVEDDNLTVNLTASTGTFSATLSEVISISGAGTGQVILTGSVLGINEYLDTSSNIEYTSDVSGGNVESFTITANDGMANSNISTVNLDIVTVNDAPIIGGIIPTDITVTEDTASEVDLSLVDFSDIDSDNLTVSLTADSGTFVATSSAEVIVGGSGSVLTLTGNSSDLNSYLDMTSNIQYIGGSNVEGDNAASFTIVANDGLLNSVVNTVNVDIAGINDEAQITGASTGTAEISNVPEILPDGTITIMSPSGDFRAVSNLMDSNITINNYSTTQNRGSLWTTNANGSSIDYFVAGENPVITVDFGSVQTLNTILVWAQGIGEIVPHTAREFDVEILNSEGVFVDGGTYNFDDFGAAEAFSAGTSLEIILSQTYATSQVRLTITDNYAGLGSLSYVESNVGNRVGLGELVFANFNDTSITGDLNHTDVDVNNADGIWQVVDTATASLEGYGTYTIDVAGNWTYIVGNSNAVANAISTGQELTDSFTVYTEDGTSQLVTVTIGRRNDAPTVGGIPTDITVTEDTASPVDLSGVNFGDIDGDDLIVSLTASAGIFTATSIGEVIVGGSGSELLTLSGGASAINDYLDILSNIQYTGASNVNGEDVASFTIVVNDGFIDSVVNTVSLDISPVNDAPVALDNQTATISEDSLLTVSPNASDVDLDILTITVDNVSNGTATVDVNGDIVFTPTANFNGEAIISYTASDDSVSDTGIITVTVTAENDAPIIGGTIPTNITISDDTASEIDLSLVEFSDVEDDNLTVNLTASTGTFSATLSEVISISGAGTGQVILTGSVLGINEYLDTSSNIEYTSDVSGGNVESFTITANDGMANSNISTVNLDIVTVNDAPIIGGIIPTDITVTEDTASEVDLSLVDFSDIDSDNLTVSLTADSGTFVATSSAEVIVGGSGSVLTLTGNSSDLNSYLDMTSNIQYIGGSNVEGDNAASFTIVANDGLLNSVVNTVNVDIAGINDEAQITGASTGTAEITNVPEILPDGTITIMSPSGDFRAVSNLMDSNITIDNYSTTQNRGGIWTTNANGSSIDYFVAGENPVITVDFGSVQTLNTILVWAQGIGEIVPHTAREFDVEILNSEGIFVDGGTYNFDDFGAAEAFSAGTSLEIILSQTYATSQVRLTITDNYAGLGSLSYVESNVGNRVGLGELVFANFNDTSITGDLNHTDVDVNNADGIWQVVDTATASLEGYGTYTIDVAGNWTYIVGNSNAVANAISTGQELTDSFTVYTEDGTSQLVTVTIGRRNDTPIVDGIPTDITVIEDTASPVDLSGVNFGDIDGDDLIVSLTASAGIFTATSIGEVIVGGSGSELLTLSGGASAINDYLDILSNIQYTGASNVNGEDVASFTIVVNDGFIDSVVNTVSLDISPVNDAPVALDNQTATISEDSLLTVSPNASDVDLDILMLTVDNVSNGTATVDVNGDIVFTPTADFNGEAIISYTASDDSISDTGIITVTVTAENDAPIIGGTIPTNITISDDTASEIDLSLVEFSDVEDDNLTVNLTASTGTFSATLSEVISISGAGTGQVILIGSVIVINEYLDTSSNIEYTSDVSGGNVESFTITANDGMANSNISTVNLDIVTVNDAPIIGGIIPTDITVTEDTASEVDLSLVDFSDIDSDNLTVSLTADSGTFVATSSAEVIVGGSGSVLTLTGNSSDLNSYLDMTSNIQYIGGSNVEGDNAASFTIVANDGLLNSVVNTVNVDIAGINDEAQITGASTGTAEITNVPEILPDGTITIMSPSGDFRAVSNLMDSNITIDNYSTTQNRGSLWTTNANGSSIDYFVAGENPVITVDFGSVQTLNTILVWAQGIGEIVPHTAREFDVEILNSEGVFVDGGTYNFDDFGAAEAFSAGTSLEIILSQTYATSQVRLTITDNYAGLGSLSYVESNVGKRVGLGELVFANFNDTSITGDLNHTDVDINNADDVWQVVDTATASIEGYGTYTIDVAGNWTYIVGNSNAVANAISTGQELTDSFTVYTEDGTSQLVTVTIARKNDTPIVDGIPTDITVIEDTASPVDLSEVVFSDIDGDDLTVSLTVDSGIFTATSSGEVTVGGSGSELLTLSGSTSDLNEYLDVTSNIQYTGASDIEGEDAASFTIVANDGFIDSVVSTVNLDISPVNDAPIIGGTVPMDITVTEDMASLVDLSLVEFSDIDGDELVVSLTVDSGTFTAVSIGEITVGGSGSEQLTLTGSASAINEYLDTTSSIEYTRASDIEGDNAASFTIVANDGFLNSSISTVNLDIREFNDAEIIGDLTGTAEITNIPVILPDGTITSSTNSTDSIKIGGGGLSEEIITLDNYLTFEERSVDSLGQGNWATQGNLSGDYYHSRDFPNPVLMIDFGSNETFNTILVWGYIYFTINNIVGSATAKVFNVAIYDSTNAEADDDGFVTVATGLDLENFNAATAFPDRRAVELSLSESYTTSQVRLTITDNYFGFTSLGDTRFTGSRVGLGELAFANLNDISITGDLNHTDVDFYNADDVWQVVENAAGSIEGYGTYTIDVTGNWTYILDNSSLVVDAFNTAGTLTDSFTVYTEDGTSQLVTVTVDRINNVPTIGGIPTDITVTEDMASSVDLSSVVFADVDGDELTVSLTADSGTFAATSSAEVIVGGSGSEVLTLSGSTSDLNNYLDTISNIEYTGASNIEGDNAASFTIVANDGSLESVESTVNLDISAVNDEAVITGITTGIEIAGEVVEAILPDGTITNSLSNDLWDTTGLSEDTITLENYLTFVEGQGANGQSWLTAISGEDYFVAGENPILSIDFGSEQTLNSLLVWGVLYNNGFVYSDTAKEFNLEILDSVSGEFVLVETGLDLEDFNVATAFGTGTAVIVSLSQAYTTSQVRLTITDNYFGFDNLSYITNNLGRVGLAGLVFANLKFNTTGDLNHTDIDSNNTDDIWQEVNTASVSTGGYGTYTIDVSGNWTYTVDVTNTTVQALGNGETLLDTFTALTEDGTQQVVTITINGENEMLTGTTGVDNLIGSLNEDTIEGLAGVDTLTGGAGNDIFVYTDADAGSSNIDTITDFVSGEDKIDLSGVSSLASSPTLTTVSSAIGEGAILTDDLLAYANAGTTTLYIDADNDGNFNVANDIQIEFSNGVSFVIGDFLF